MVFLYHFSIFLLYQSANYGHGGVGNGTGGAAAAGAVASKPTIQPININIMPPSSNVINNYNSNNGAASPSQMKSSGITSDSLSRPGK